jgi:YidC/Oxa1 family membrane protein insertase
MSDLFNNFLVIPLYNFLILIINHIPFADLGFAIILLTVLIRFVLYPLSKSAIKTQLKMKEIQKPLEEIKQKYKGDQQQAALEMMKFYKENDIRPFSGMLLILVQLPIIFALYFVFLNEGLPNINLELLYSFVIAPGHINTNFLGIFDLTSKSVSLALLAGIAQFFQAQIMFKRSAQTTSNSNDKKAGGFQEDLMKSMQIQVKYVLPGIMIGIAYSLGSVIALYFLTSNLFSIFQELFLKKQLEKSIANKTAIIK